MAEKQKSRRADDLVQRQGSSTPLADAIAIGAAASGLVVGTMQATQALEPGDDEHGAVKDMQTVDFASSEPATRVATTDQAPSISDGRADEPLSADPAAVMSTSASPQPLMKDFDMATDAHALSPAAQITQVVAAQIGAGIDKVVTAVAGGANSHDVSQTLAADIVQAAQAIVEQFKLDDMAGHTKAQLADVTQAVDVPALVETVLEATSGIATGTLDDVGTLLDTVATLPSSILGNEGPEDGGGLLSEIFYPDGGSDSGLAIPDLSTSATNAVLDATGAVTGLLGVSYIDADNDGSGGHGLNALSLL